MSDNEGFGGKSKRKLSNVEASSDTGNNDSKQPAYKKRFQPEWLGSYSPFKAWVRPIYDNKNKCKCIACDTILVCGKSELDKHASSKKHQKRVQDLPKESPSNAAVPPLVIDIQMLPQPSPLDEERSMEIPDEDYISMKKEKNMAQTHFALSWDSYQSSVCSHFSVLQQNGEFVDLTLAADGHLVKVHQLILGIASPYIKQLIHSASCPHPVIFLNNVSYSTLSSILQYVYTGEVAVAEEELTPFFEAAKALQIQGIDTSDVNTESVRDRNDGRHLRLDSKTGLHTIQLQVQDDKISHYESVSVPMAAKNVKLTNQQTDEVTLGTSSSSFVAANTSKKQTEDLDDTLMMDEDMENEAPDECGDANPVEYFELTHVEDDSPSVYPNTKELQYTVSNRGSLQLILNRYVYNLFSKSKGGVVRRWRCVDYRNHKCPACTITNGNVVVKRTNLHNHPFHDKKILGKISKKAVYSAIKLAEADKNSTEEKS